MTTTCQTIYTAARSFAPIPPSVLPTPTDLLLRIRADQQALFTATTAIARDRFQTVATATSTAATSGRVVDLSALSLPVERIIRVDLADGRTASQVDVQDLEAELAPRYLVRGLTLVEVSNDWNTTTGAAQTVTVTYAYGPAAISPTGLLTQTVSVPDEWTDLLILPLALYLHRLNPTPNAVEADRLTALLDERTTAYVSYLKTYGGVEARRFDLPSPASVPQKP